LLLLLALSVLFREDLFSMFGGGGAPMPDGGAGMPMPEGGGALPAPPTQTTATEEQLVDFVSFVLDDVQTTWTSLAPTLGVQYENTKLVLFRDAIESTCGFAEAAVGPFYCPLDAKVYIDLSFYDDLRARFGAPGDFAQAYVLAHEVAHHVQNLMGLSARVRQASQADPSAANELSVRLELQADCFAGVWGHMAAERGILEAGDLEEGLNAAAQIGDDRMMRRAGRGIVPEAFTHGSAEQRVEWLRRGLESGRCQDCDTFSVQ
jgi:predicted metalloprotease